MTGAHGAMNDLGTPRGPSDSGLSVTGVYTAGAYRAARIPKTKLTTTRLATLVYVLVNAVTGFARLFRRDVPSLARLVVARHRLFDALVRSAAERSVVELAAGFSARGLRMLSERGGTYADVDLPDVVRLKRKILARSTEGRAALTSNGYNLVGADLRTADLSALVPGARGTSDAGAGEEPDTLREVRAVSEVEAEEFVGGDDSFGSGTGTGTGMGRGSSSSVLFVAEGLVMYFDRGARLELYARIRSAIERAGGGRLLFDLTPWDEEPKPGCLGRLLERLLLSFAKKRHLPDRPRTRRDVIAELTGVGFRSVTVHVTPIEARLPRTEIVVFEATAP